ncbi:serpin family protein [Actinospica sp.]|uniref:serpin family protein n=1 Tax=Actinospica sp. TaxID=1872142 RepID=UPI002B9147F5|nr:serpin family protein [Actinospica sp.]HWG28305.1 serpin family protein [Actinospica sp.]
MRRKTILRTLLAAALPAGLLAGCSSGDGSAPVAYVTAKNAADITVSSAALQQAETGSESFGLALLRQLGDGTSGNMVFSPQTLVDLLAMILPGAKGQTASQLSDALGTAGLDARTAAGALGKIDASARADGNQNSNTLDESSDVWTDKTVKLAQSYLAALDGAFGAGVHQTDFQTNADGATQAIDDLVAQETHGYITNLFSKGSLDASTRVVLTDAVYLDASWADKFDPNKTMDNDFYSESGAARPVPMMSSQAGYDYASGKGWQLVELPYAGGKLAMDVVLPAKGTGNLKAFRDSLSAAQLNSMLSSMTKQPVQLSLPKFTTNFSPENLIQSLSALGLGDLFKDADLTGVTSDGEQLAVSQIVERAHIAVAENGTIAAAAAGGAMVTSAEAPKGVVFDADHPFLYLIRDLSTGQLLFAGQQTSGS